MSDHLLDQGDEVARERHEDELDRANDMAGLAEDAYRTTFAESETPAGSDPAGAPTGEATMNHLESQGTQEFVEELKEFMAEQGMELQEVPMPIYEENTAVFSNGLITITVNIEEAA